MGKKTKKDEYESYNIPKTLKVGAVTYKILFPYDFNEDSTYIGLHEYEELCIKLGAISPSHQNVDMPKQSVYKHFLHEVIHAIDIIFCDGFLSEAETEAFAIGWHSLLFENDLGLKSNGKTPEKVKIFSFIYDVNYIDFKDTEDQAICCENCCYISLSNRVKDQDMSLQKRLFVHMLNSVISRIFELRPTSDKQEYSDKLFRGFSSGLYQVLCDNNLESMFKCLRNGKK